MDLCADCYGQELRIELRTRVRDELRFDGVEALKAQIGSDVQTARDYFAKERKP